MKRNCIAMLGLAVIPAILTVSAATASQTDANTAQAEQLVQAGKASEADALLSPILESHASDSGFNYILGIAALDSSHLAEAILAFQRVLAVRPDHAQARAELARAYALTGDVDTARREFDTVAGDPTIPDPVRQRFNSLVRGLDKTRTRNEHSSD